MGFALEIPRRFAFLGMTTSFVEAVSMHRLLRHNNKTLGLLRTDKNMPLSF
jgi:hypothetical protein